MSSIHLSLQRSMTRILCVDDDEMVHAHLQAAFGMEAVVREARSGKDGLEALSRGPVDWVILDYRLGDMTGGEFLIAAYRRGYRPHYVLASGTPMSRLDWAGLRPFGVKGSLAKPMDLVFLKALLESGGDLRGEPVAASSRPAGGRA